MLLSLAIAFPGIIVRWVILRRPLNPVPSLVIAGTFWGVLVFLSHYSGGQSPPTFSMLGAVLLYFALTAPNRTRGAASDADSTPTGENETTMPDHSESSQLSRFGASKQKNPWANVLIAGFVGALVGAACTGAYFKLSQPTSRDECLLKYLKGNQSEPAALTIIGACRREFPK